MYRNIQTYAYICIHVCMCTYTYITSIYSFIDIYVSNLCIYIYTEIFRHTCTCIYSYILLLSRFSRVRLCATPWRQPTRLPCPWDSPGKNTGVGCHFLLQCMKVKSESEVAQLCPTVFDPMDCSPPGSSIRGIFQARVLEWGAIAFSDSYIYMCLYISVCVCHIFFSSPVSGS